MKRIRLVAAVAAILTALLLQATVVAPVALPWAVSLPAVLVAAVALVDGPGTGLSLGFVTGLVADLGSAHPAGVLALAWMGVGVICGLRSRVGPARRSLRREVIATAVVCSAAASLVTLLLALVGAGGAAARSAVTGFVPVLIGDALLALVLLPLVRRFLRSPTLRAPELALRELDPEPVHG